MKNPTLWNRFLLWWHCLKTLHQSYEIYCNGKYEIGCVDCNKFNEIKNEI
jgi:hypothetical protein